MRLTRSVRSRAIKAAYPAASLLTEKPTPSGRTCTSKRPFETSIPTKTSCNAIILSPSCDCGREPRQLFGREMKGSAGALARHGGKPHDCLRSRCRRSPDLAAARAAPRTMDDSAETRLLRRLRLLAMTSSHRARFRGSLLPDPLCRKTCHDVAAQREKHCNWRQRIDDRGGH